MLRSILSFSRAESHAYPYAWDMGRMLAGIPDTVAESMMSPLRPVRWLRSSAREWIRCFKGSSAPRGMQLAVVIPLNDEIANYATKLQIGILRKYGRNPGLDARPHITLKMGFYVPDIAPFEEYLGHLAAETLPFEITIRDFGTFDEGILFLDVEPNPALENLRQRILTDLSARHGIEALEIEGPQFHYHITLAYGLSERAFAELRETMASERVRFNFNVRHIDLFCHTGEQWVTYKRVALREASSSSNEASSLSAQSP